ncbi:MAG: EAL domain-containing protein, partial [Pseudomonadota bacterium]
MADGLLMLAGLAAGLVPIAVVMALSYIDTVRRAERDLNAIAVIAGKVANHALDTARLDLGRFVTVTDLELTPTARRLLDDIVYRNPFYREAGVIDAAGMLVHSTAAGFVEPFPASPETRADPSLAEVQVVGLFRTRIADSESIIVALPVPRRGEVNLLLDPGVLTLAFDEVDLGPRGRLVFADEDGRTLVSTAPAGLVGGAGDEGHTIVTTQPAGGGQLLVVAEIDRRWVFAHWYDELFVAVPVAGLSGLTIGGLLVVQRRRRRGLDRDLEAGLARGELSVEYQPILHLETGDCVGAEALMRWHHPLHGPVSPSVFVPIAETSGLIGALTQWLLRRVADDEPTLTAASRGIYVTVNCTPSLFVGGGLEDAVDRAKLPAELVGRLVFEVTENVFIGDRAPIVDDVMTRLRRQGFRFALDDFGTGYSSLATLQDLRFDFVKIDRRFVSAVDRHGPAAGLFETLVDLAVRFGAEPVAEGVETEAQRAHVAGHGVRLAQGWLF